MLATLPADRVRAAVEDLAVDADVRVQGPALRALAQGRCADADQRIAAALEAPDFALRAAAAALVGERQSGGRRRAGSMRPYTRAARVTRPTPRAPPR